MKTLSCDGLVGFFLHDSGAGQTSTHKKEKRGQNSSTLRLFSRNICIDDILSLTSFSQSVNQSTKTCMALLTRTDRGA